MFLTSPRKSPAVALWSAALLLCFPLVFQAQDARTPSRQQANTQSERAMSGGNRAHPVGAVAVSPDGKHLAWVEGGRRAGEIRVTPLDNLGKADFGNFERITAATSPGQHCREGQLTWSPDSKSLAFFSDCASQDSDSGDQADLYLARLDPANTAGSPARRLTQLKGFVSAPAFSPDGKAIAFLYVAGATRPAGALAAMKPPSGVIGEDGVEIQRVAVAEVAVQQPAAPTFATPANLHVYEFDWAPDSKSLAYIAADPPGENNWWVAKLYTQEVSGTPKVDPRSRRGCRARCTDCRSPCRAGLRTARRIAFIGGLMSDQGVTGGRRLDRAADWRRTA